jgi:hypothetical protein
MKQLMQKCVRGVEDVTSRGSNTKKEVSRHSYTWGHEGKAGKSLMHTPPDCFSLSAFTLSVMGVSVQETPRGARSRGIVPIMQGST